MMINLYKSREGECYMAQFIGDQEIVDMFGTNTIPRGFTGQSKPEVMIATMQRLNPGHVLVLTHGRMEPVATYGSIASRIHGLRFPMGWTGGKVRLVHSVAQLMKDEISC